MKRTKLVIMDAHFNTAGWLGALFSKVSVFQKLSDIDCHTVVAFEGGTDIRPGFYGQLPGYHTQPPHKYRDDLENEAFRKAVRVDAGIVGICRGAQLACALSGGSLIQHVTGHVCSTGHFMATKDSHHFAVTSHHHQMMYPFDMKEDEFELIGWAASRDHPRPMFLSDRYLGADDRDHFPPDTEPEIVWFPVTQSIAIQGHPEWATPNGMYQNYCRDLVRKYL